MYITIYSIKMCEKRDNNSKLILSVLSYICNVNDLDIQVSRCQMLNIIYYNSNYVNCLLLYLGINMTALLQVNLIASFLLISNNGLWSIRVCMLIN